MFSFSLSFFFFCISLHNIIFAALASFFKSTCTSSQERADFNFDQHASYVSYEHYLTKKNSHTIYAKNKFLSHNEEKERDTIKKPKQMHLVLYYSKLRRDSYTYTKIEGLVNSFWYHGEFLFIRTCSRFYAFISIPFFKRISNNNRIEKMNG